MEITIKIPLEVLEEAFNCERDVILTAQIQQEDNKSKQDPPDKKPERKKAIVSQLKRYRKQFLRPPEEQTIIDLWNNHPYIQSVHTRQVNDARNQLVTTNEYPQVIPVLQKTLKVISLEKLRELVEHYLLVCSRREHIWDGTNHGFKHQGGLLSKIISCQKMGQLPWWETNVSDIVTDEHPEITECVAKAYFDHYVHIDSYNSGLLDKYPSLHKMLVKLSSRIYRILEELDSSTLVSNEQIAQVASWVFRCADSKWGKENVRPSGLINEEMWGVDFLRYLSDQVSLPSSSIEIIRTVISNDR